MCNVLAVIVDILRSYEYWFIVFGWSVVISVWAIFSYRYDWKPCPGTWLFVNTMFSLSSSLSRLVTPSSKIQFIVHNQQTLMNSVVGSTNLDLASVIQQHRGNGRWCYILSCSLLFCHLGLVWHRQADLKSQSSNPSYLPKTEMWRNVLQNADSFFLYC